VLALLQPEGLSQGGAALKSSTLPRRVVLARVVSSTGGFLAGLLVVPGFLAGLLVLPAFLVGAAFSVGLLVLPAFLVGLLFAETRPLGGMDNGPVKTQNSWGRYTQAVQIGRMACRQSRTYNPQPPSQPKTNSKQQEQADIKDSAFSTTPATNGHFKRHGPRTLI
jgi:hypothetical protein